ncbi:hypothetical protein [Campylobacter sp.]|nr:hypothetical protein [Campylobacter sp.]MDY4012725.1 hypothetical protein [Campylobacter sp.]
MKFILYNKIIKHDYIVLCSVASSNSVVITLKARYNRCFVQS